MRSHNVQEGCMEWKCVPFLRVFWMKFTGGGKVNLKLFSQFLRSLHEANLYNFRGIENSGQLRVVGKTSADD